MKGERKRQRNKIPKSYQKLIQQFSLELVKSTEQKETSSTLINLTDIRENGMKTFSSNHKY